MRKPIKFPTSRESKSFTISPWISLTKMVKLAGLSTIILFILLHAATPISGLSKLDFPPEFVFGAGTSAYQVEGAAAEDGRKPSIWDTFTHQGKSYDKRTGDIASDQYHHYKEDVKLMHEMGLDAYRFSMSWSRIIPDGRGAVNPKGLNYYNNLINELISYGIEAHVTLSHFDIPQALQDEYGGYLSPKLIEDFTAYADVCFQEYGDRVKTWVTFNEPNIDGYGFMNCSSPMNCSTKQIGEKDSLIFGHNLLLAHAAAVQLYRTTYQENQKGEIGITLLALWFEPPADSAQDMALVALTRDSILGWFLDPLVHGKYPDSMMKYHASRLPNITEEESKRIKGSFNFIGINNYGGVYFSESSGNSCNYKRALGQDFTRLKADSTVTLKPCLPEILEYIKQKYSNPTVIIHENGYMTTVDDSSDPSARNDTKRVEFLQRNIKSLLQPIRNGSDVRGYFAWSFIDVFESYGGYSSKYGLYGVDSSRRRYLRQSARWYSSFLAKIKSGMNTEKFVYVDSE